MGNQADAEDVVQEAYVKAFRALKAGEFDRRSSTATWLYRIVVNGAIDAKRSRTRRAEQSDMQIDPSWDGAAFAEARLALTELDEWLELLPADQRARAADARRHEQHRNRPSDGRERGSRGTALGSRAHHFASEETTAVTDLEDIDQRLLRLGRSSEALRPSAGFSARVMQAISAEAVPSFLENAWFSSRRLLPVAAIAAALAVVWAVQVDRSVDDELATSYASVELE